MNTVPIDHCKFIRCPECGGSGTKVVDLEAWQEGFSVWDYCELCMGAGEYLEIDYAEDGDEVIEDE